MTKLSSSSISDPNIVARPEEKSANAFALFLDEGLTQPTPYHAKNDYFLKAKDRMDRTVGLLENDIAGKTILDIGASPFYLLYKAQQLGAAHCNGLYFANDEHPLKSASSVFSEYGPIKIAHVDVETEDFPFPDESQDVITACEVVEHLEYFPVRLAKEIRRTIRPGGLVCLTVPNVASIGNILKLIFQKNIYMKYRSDPTGRHKHEYTRSQLISLARFMGINVSEVGFLPTPTSDKMWLRPAYRLMALIPGLRRYSPAIYVIGRYPNPKPAGGTGALPKDLYTDSPATEE